MRHVERRVANGFVVDRWGFELCVPTCPTTWQSGCILGSGGEGRGGVFQWIKCEQMLFDIISKLFSYLKNILFLDLYSPDYFTHTTIYVRFILQFTTSNLNNFLNFNNNNW